MKLGRHSKNSNKNGTFKQGKSRAQANITGYEKRLARKAESTPITDLYEHIPEKTRRSKVALDLGRDEGFEFPNAWDGEEQEELRARLIGENEDNEDIDSGDDEEIDSDAAFEESDEERFADFFSKKTHTDEEEKEEEDGDGEASDQDSDTGSDSGSEEKLDFDPSDDEEMPEALDRLDEFVSNLDVTSKKRKAAEEPSDVGASADTRAHKRRLVKERTETGAENEFRARSSGSKLNIDDLLAPLASQSSALQSLKSSAKVLASSSSSKAKTLSAPLPQRIQERLDRQAAYENTKEEVDKWSETMKHIREAEHLSFPLQSQSAGRVSNLELTAKFKPTTALESAVDALLKSAKLRDEDIHHTEDAMLQMKQFSVEEVAQRQGELRKMRELMFRAETKARRVGKIKSKTYRRIKRKEKERLGEKINGDDSQDGEEEILKKELDRARERATLRHKHTGKWARQMRNKEGLDADGRRDIEDMLARGEKLRRRIKGIGSEESEDGSEDQDDGDDDGLDVEGGLEKIKQDAFNDLRKLNEAERLEGDEKRNGKSVFEMKFMKNAMARQMQVTDKSTDDFITEIGIGGNTGTDDTDNEEQENGSRVFDSSSGVLVRRTGGRVTYRPSEMTHHISTTRPLAASETSSMTLKSTDQLSPPPPSPIPNRLSVLSTSSTQKSNAWLTRASEVIVKTNKKANEVVVQKGSEALDKSKNKLKKRARKREEEREKVRGDEFVEVSLDHVLTLPTGPSGSSPSEPVGKTGQQPPIVHADEDESDGNSEVEAQENVTLKGNGKVNGIKAFAQRDLVALAFAGDNIVQSFEEAKSREIASDAPREVDTTIPGWGSWGGSGMRNRPPKPQRIKKIAGIDPTTRADFNKKHIIISEKRDKKAAKYLVKDLPHPYTSKAQFERAMENPLGAEWNTRVAFQRATLPRVVKKPGVIINPLEKPTS
ncbi:small-subunit processome [Phlegmacium glaucopus]|nr:small-subunit processome [Phlegmacium glaucopus]